VVFRKDPGPLNVLIFPVHSLAPTSFALGVIASWPWLTHSSGLSFVDAGANTMPVISRGPWLPASTVAITC
jgi:hypothetical protein